MTINKSLIKLYLPLQLITEKSFDNRIHCTFNKKSFYEPLYTKFYCSQTLNDYFLLSNKKILNKNNNNKNLELIGSYFYLNDDENINFNNENYLRNLSLITRNEILSNYNQLITDNNKSLISINIFINRGLFIYFCY